MAHSPTIHAAYLTAVLFVTAPCKAADSTISQPIGQNVPDTSQADALKKGAHFADRLVYKGVAINDPEYLIWGSAPVVDDSGTFHIFSTRWPVKQGFANWRVYSEIAHYRADSPTGPFEYVSTVVPSTDEAANRITAHNSCMKKIDDKYVLLFISYDKAYMDRKDIDQTAKISMMIADSPDGPWQKANGDGFVLAPPTDNTKWAYQSKRGVENPTILKWNGKYHLYYSAIAKDSTSTALGVAIADKLEGPYIHEAEQAINPGSKKIEDSCAFVENGKLKIVTCDNFGILEYSGGILWETDDDEAGKRFKIHSIGFHHFPMYFDEETFAAMAKHTQDIYGRYRKLERPKVLTIDGKARYFYAPSGSNYEGGPNTQCHVFEIQPEKKKGSE